MLVGCNSFMNSWLDPTAVGNFTRETTLEIRTSLSIQDPPLGIPGATDPQPEDLVPYAEEYRVGPGDVMTVRIFELLARNTETASQATVDEIGTIVLPVLGQVRVAGLTRSEITQEIINLLRERGILEDATVIVELIVRRGQTYTIFGATAAPNLYPIPKPDTRLLEVLNTSGGFIETVTEIYVIRAPKTPSAPGAAVGASWQANPRTSTVASLAADELGSGTGADQALYDAANPAGKQARNSDVAAAAPPSGKRWVFVNGEWIEVEEPEAAPIAPTAPPVDQPQLPVPSTEVVPEIDWDRLAGEPQEARIIRIDAEALRNGDPRQNIVIRDGDTIRVVAGQVGEYYIMGQVFRPGAYSITGREITLKAAIAAAGNIAPLGWPDRCTIYRRIGDRESMHQVNLDAIFAGKEADVMIKDHDLILVGTHPAAPFLAVIRNAFRMTYGFGFVYDRNFADIDSYGSKINPDNFPSTSPLSNLFR